MGRFTSDDYKPQFAGHETFPIRMLWLKKSYDALVVGGGRQAFTSADAIVRFGVGKNMAQAMRYWVLASGFAEDIDGEIQPSALGRLLFDDQGGLDPYLECPATIWLLHLALAGSPEMTTTWYWAFNHYGHLTFDRDVLARALLAVSADRDWKRVAPVTVKRDVDCFIRSYVARSRGHGGEDAIEPVLVELGLIRESAIGDAYEFVRGPKSSLPDAVFAIGLARYWRSEHVEASTLSAEAVCYAAGSPGRVFKLDEDSVVERLMRIDQVTEGDFRWSETAGLRQVMRVEWPNECAVLARAYRSGARLAA